MIARLLADQLESELPEEILPMARFVSGLPRKFFPRNFNSPQSSLIRETIAAHATVGKTSEWWEWHQSLPEKQRVSHDTTFVRHLLGHDVVEIGPGSWSGGAEIELEPEVVHYLQLVEVFSRVPHHRPIEERVATVLRNLRPVVPEAIKVLSRFRYLSPAEILENADQLAEALPVENTQKWQTLISIADDENRQDLVRKFKEQR